MLTLAQKFSSAMNGIDDEFIEEALTYERSKKRTSSRALRIVLVAALISVLLITSTLALSPSFRVNTLNTLIEIFSDHLTISFDGEEAPLSRTAGKIDCSTLEGTYRIPPEHSNRASFFNSVRLFGSSGEEIGINVTVISQTLVGDYDIADDAESKSITLYGKDATLYWGEGQNYAGETGTKAAIIQIDEENGWIVYFWSRGLSPDELVSVAEQVKIT